MVRNLVSSVARVQGVNTERWDGLDESGKPLPAGTYTWKGLYHRPLKTKFILSVHNSGDPPYKKDDNTGGWGGDHGSPTTTCALPDGMLLAWSCSESGWGLLPPTCAEKIVGHAWGFHLPGHRRHAARLRQPGLGDDRDHVRVYAVSDGRPLTFGPGQAFIAPRPAARRIPIW